MSNTSLLSELEARRAEFKNKAAEDVQALMAETEAQQRSAGVGAGAPRAGAVAPDFTLTDAHGAPVRLADRLPAIVVFYRGGWCPYCNITLKAWQRALPELTAAGIALLAISPQTPDGSLSTAEKNELGYDVLSDVGSRVADAYGVAFRLDARLAALYERMGNNLPAINGTGDWRLPLPATFAVGTDGRVRASHVDNDYRVRMEPVDAIAALVGERVS